MSQITRDQHAWRLPILCSCASLLLLGATVGCDTRLPSEQLRQTVRLPIPASANSEPADTRLSPSRSDEEYVISPRSLIDLAFDLQPDVKSSYQAFKSEEARYDFFFVSRDSLTPRLRIQNDFSEGRASEVVTRNRSNSVELSVEKLFFDTTEVNVGVGYASAEVADDIGNQPFLFADLRYPLFASRERLVRSSEEIFRRNLVNDAQLAYIQQVRRRLQNAMFQFYEVADLARRVENNNRWKDTLERLLSFVQQINGRDTEKDQQRLAAEIARVESLRSVVQGRYGVEMGRLKAAIGVPMYAQVVLDNVDFDPFAGMTHSELLQVSIERDPEIATLKNEVDNATVQLDLARRGTWDISLLLSGASNFEGRGADEGTSDWAASVGLDVSHVDPRVTTSLARQAQARINRFTEAIAARENQIFADLLEPVIRIETLGESRQQRLENLPRFRATFAEGEALYTDGEMSIDVLLQRRENVFDEEEEISRLTFLIGANIAELCAATGKFFEFLEENENFAIED